MGVLSVVPAALVADTVSVQIVEGSNWWMV